MLKTAVCSQLYTFKLRHQIPSGLVLQNSCAHLHFPMCNVNLKKNVNLYRIVCVYIYIYKVLEVFNKQLYHDNYMEVFFLMKMS